MIQVTEKSVSLDGNCAFVDFELDAYSQLDIELELEAPAALDIALGEVASGNRVNREPGGFRIIRTMQKECAAGKSSFAFDLPHHKSPYSNNSSVPLPPEAGNREIVPFRYVKEVQKRCQEQLDLELVVRDAAKTYIVEKAYDRKYGARPLKRKIQDEIEDKLAEEIIAGNIKAGDSVSVSVKKDAICISK